MTSPFIPCPFQYNDAPNGGSVIPTIIADRDPGDNDKLDIGYGWINQVAQTSFTLTGYTSGIPVWTSGGNAEATTSSFGIVQLATLAELQGGSAPAGAYVPTANDVATVIAGIVVGAVPPATETQQGIAELATQAETDAGTDDTKIVTPLKLANFVGSGGVPGSFTDLTATGTVSFTGATGAFTITSATASSVGTTGAGIDLTLSSASGSVPISAGEAVANAIGLQAAAGGIDIDGALQVNIASSQNAVDAIRLVASAGGIDIDAVGAATEDINITNTGGSIVLQATESAVDSIDIISTAGGIRLRATGAAATEDISLTATGSSIVLSATEAVSDAINIDATAGGIDVDAVGQINIATSQSANDSIVIESTAGGIDILASGAGAGEDIDIFATGSSVNVTSTENAAQAVYIRANGGTSETLQIHADQGTGAASVLVLSDVGGVTIQGGLSSADAINIVASAVGGGIDIDSGTAGVIVDTSGAISLDSAAASNFTVTGAFALDVGSTLGKVTLSSGQNAADSVVITSLIGGIDILAAGAAAGEDIDIVATGSSVNITSTENATDSIVITSTVGGIQILAAGAAATEDIVITATGSSVRITATESATDSINIESTAGGINVLASGAAAGEDINITATGSSVNITATEAAANAIVITSSNAAGGIDLTTGGGSIDLSSAGFATVVANTANVASPTAASIQNVNVGAATFTGFTTAAAGIQDFTITNSLVTIASVLLVTVCNEGANDAQMSIRRITRAAGSFVVKTVNNGAAALNGNVTVSWWLLQA